MKKIFISVALMALSAVPAMAGGLLANTNQSAAFVRQMSLNGAIDIAALYNNPAGTAFLPNGWHLSLSSQTAIQQRNIETQFPLFALNQSTLGNDTHRFEGKAFAPVIPSFSLSYNHNKWSVDAHFALGGGGGKCEFDNGLGSFEALYAGNIYKSVATNVAQQLAMGAAQQYAQTAIPQYMAAGLTYEQAVAAVAAPAEEFGRQYAAQNLNATMGQVYQGYNLDAYMKGRSYYFGFQLGGTYKFTDNFAGFLGLRGVYATCNYNGYVKDVTYTVSGVTANANADLELDCSQTGFGITPIVGFDWKVCNEFNFAVKYEAPTKMNLKNSTTMNDYAKAQVAAGNATLAKFADGAKVREDVPGLLSVGFQYQPIEKLRLNAGVTEYFDKTAKKYNDDHKKIRSNTWDFNLGAEYDVCKYVTVSASYQTTQYDLYDEYMSDLSFNLSNHMVGAGVRINATDRISIDLGYMHTFYGDRTVEMPTEAGVKSDNFVRKNDVAGIGVNFKF